jgi:hypothetical protein
VGFVDKQQPRPPLLQGDTSAGTPAKSPFDLFGRCRLHVDAGATRASRTLSPWTICERGVRPSADDRNPDQCRREGGWSSSRARLERASVHALAVRALRSPGCVRGSGFTARARPPPMAKRCNRSRSRQRPARTAWRRSRVVLRRSRAVIGARAGAAGALRRPARQRLRPSMARGRARACRRPRGSRPPTSRPRPQGDR